MEVPFRVGKPPDFLVMKGLALMAWVVIGFALLSVYSFLTDSSPVRGAVDALLPEEFGSPNQIANDVGKNAWDAVNQDAGLSWLIVIVIVVILIFAVRKS